MLKDRKEISPIKHLIVLWMFTSLNELANFLKKLHGNVCQELQMNSISFHFLEYPTFDDLTPTTKIYMAVGETINMPCNATGSPSPSISLKKQTTVPRRGRRSRDKRNFLILNGRYTITNAVTMDFGTYVCTATNGLGSVSKQIEIVKGGIRNDCSITN